MLLEKRFRSGSRAPARRSAIVDLGNPLRRWSMTRQIRERCEAEISILELLRRTSAKGKCRSSPGSNDQEVARVDCRMGRQRREKYLGSAADAIVIEEETAAGALVDDAVVWRRGATAYPECSFRE